MGYSQLCLLLLLLLLSSYSLAQEGSDTNEQTPRCLLATRFKAYRKYVYQYTTESRNGVVGAANQTNGPKLSCQVEIEVPQTCRFIMHTRLCCLSDVSVLNPGGQPLDQWTPGSEAFQAAMEKNPLKFTVEDVTRVQLYPETDEPVNIVNIKRGIVSALVVPIMEDEQNSLMSTVHGQCVTDRMVNARKDSAPDVTLSRDLSQCDRFYSRELAGSPLALLQKLHRPMSKLIASTQECNYQFDNRGKHISTATCREKHVHMAFSNEYTGISSVVTQNLSFQSSKRTNNRAFDVNRSQSKPLHFEDPDDKAPVQTTDAALRTLQDLMALAGTDQGQRRAGLFHKLVSNLRALRNDTLSETVSEMLGRSGWLTWQALLQCGTPECTSAILQAIRTLHGVSLEADALVYALSLQANPDAARVRDMLSMAQFKQSRAIMYALANTVKKFHKGEVTPVVTDVAEFMETLLNDCSGEILHRDSDIPPNPEDVSFLVLRVAGVMGPALQAVSPSLISSILRCAQKTDIPLSNQKAAIQALRLMDIDDEIRNILLEVYQDDQSPVEKRVAAYLVLMKNPDRALVRNIVDNCENIRDEQLHNFVATHLNNIRKSEEPQMRQLREYIELATNELLAITNKARGVSQNYRGESPLGSVQSNVIFDSTNTLPKEVVLDTTLRLFDDNYDIFGVSIEGAGFEPTIDALFGEKGFFPDSISKVLHWAGNQAQMLRGVLDRMEPDRVKREVPQDLLSGIRKTVQRIVNDLLVHPAPEATAYLRLFGNEMGYMKTSDIKKLAGTLLMYYHVFIRILPAEALFALTSSTDNQVFAHYIFLENAFSLPTASGFPLKFSLAGVLAPGAKGGLTPLRAETSVSFAPSVGLEFITQMGVYVPEYLDTWLEMHTSMYHESTLNAKVTVNMPEMRLSIPAPRSSTQLLSVSNTLLSISSGKAEIVPSSLEDRTDSNHCQPLFSGLKLCTVMRYPNAASSDQAPHYPLSGETRFAVEIQPTGEVSEYAATITHGTSRDSKKSRHAVDYVTLTLKAEGADSTEATAFLRYDRNNKVVTADVVIPDHDVEARVKLALTAAEAKGKWKRGFTIDVTNNNISQLTVVGNTRLDMMKDAMLQLQMDIPSLKMDASFTAGLKKDEGLLMDLETVIKLPETLCQQKASLRYDEDKFELELKSDMNSEIQKLIPDVENHHRQLQQLIDHMLDQRVAMTDMKYRHIVSKGLQAGDIWLEKLTARIPYLANLRSRRSISDLTLPGLPEKLFQQSESLLRYQFNKDKIEISLPLPLGGKTSEELNIPTTVNTPIIDLQDMGVHFPANKYRVPSFTIPPSLDFTVPLLGLAEASTKINSNLYSWEGSISGGNNTVDVPSYIAHFKAIAQSPFNLLSYKLEGTGIISGRPDDHLKYVLNTSFSHSLIDTSFSVSETLRVADKLYARANYKMEASSPIGLQASLQYSARSTTTPGSEEVSGDGTMDVLLQIGSFYTNTSYIKNYNLLPLDGEGRGQSTLFFKSPFIHVHNTITGVYANSELNILSKTNTQNDILIHVVELTYKDAQLTLKSDAVATGMGKTFNNKAEIGVSRQMAILRMESQADDGTNTVQSLITGSLDSNGLEVNSEGSVVFDTGRGLHKASVVVGRNGLTASGTNSIQSSPVTVVNIFNGAIDNKGAIISSNTTMLAEDSTGELNIEGTITDAEASLQGVLKGHAHDATTRNNVNIVLNPRALTFTSDIMGALKQMSTENSHTLALTLWTVSLQSKSHNVICEDIYYKQDTKVDMKPFVIKFDMTNDLRFHDVGLNTEGHMRLAPVKVDLSGGMRGNYGEDHNIKSTYELNYNNMAGSMKSCTSGNVMGAQLSNNCELQFAGLSSMSDCETRINSEPLHFNSTVRTIALPFSLSVDSLVNSGGEINLDGKHTGQLCSKMLIKAEPLALAFSHDSRISTTHMLPSGESSTSVNNKVDGLLTPTDQSLAWKVKSKLNNHSYNQDISAYNNPKKIGFEFSGIMSTDIFSKFSRHKSSLPEIQDFSVAGVLKYDKNSDCHILEDPFIQSFPAAFEQLKNTLVQALESLQSFIYNLDINQIIFDFRSKVDQLPMQVNDFMREMELESKINQVKTKLDYLINEFSVTMDDLEVVMDKMRKKLENMATEIVNKIRDFALIVKDYLNSGQLADNITNVLSHIENHLLAFDKRYKIKQTLMQALDVIEDIIRQIDLQKLSDSSITLLKEFDSEYLILDKIKEKLFEMKLTIENFDIHMFLQDVKYYLLSVDLAQYVEQLSEKIPSSEISSVIESMNDVIVNWIDEYEISNKLNAVYSYVRDLLLKYNLDERFKELMDQVVILIKQFRIDETMQSLANAIENINFEFIYDKIMQFLNNVTNELKAIDFENSIIYINECISSILKSLKDFDYSLFVSETNGKIAELTDYINEQIQMYEIVQKIEAVREFLREIQGSVFSYLDKVKNTKVADALKKLNTVADTAFYNDIKMKLKDMLEDMRQRITDMDIRDEIYLYLQRASESYGNMVAYTSVQCNQLMENIRKVAQDSELLSQIKEAAHGVSTVLTRAEIEVPAFVVPLTDLVIPALTINLNKLQEIRIPDQIPVPEFTILGSYTIPAFTIDFDAIKSKIVAIIDDIREFEIQMPGPEAIFGDLKLLYLSDLPDLTFPEITLSEIKFPAINIPTLNLKDFEIALLQIPEIKLPEVTGDICIPVFGKIQGEFRVNSPLYNLVTTGKIENTTSLPKHPQFTAIIMSHATSPIEALEYTFEATAQLEAPRLKKLMFREDVKAAHVAFTVDHGGSLTLTGSSAVAYANTATKATTQLYKADLLNNIALTLKSGISAVMDTTYNHILDIPLIETSSQASVKQNVAATMESGIITVTSETTGNGKWSIQDYSDEGTHKSNVVFNVNFDTAKLTFVGETDCKGLKSKQALTAESVLLSHITVEGRCETEGPSVKRSLMVLNGEGHIWDLKVALTAAHDAEFNGHLTGSMANSLDFMVHPFEIVLDVKNKVNSKIFLPLKLTGKVDLEHDYGLMFNSEKQGVYYFALARFNQYKYNHNFAAENNEMDMFFHLSANAEANLDFLTVPLSIPDITIPYLEINTPEVRDFSLWEHAGFKAFLSTPQQSFDMSLKLHYYKSPDAHSFELNLEPIYSAISDNANVAQAQFEKYKDKVVSLLNDSYYQAKSQYIKHKIETSSQPPRIFTVPGFKIPVLNIEVSAFRAEMPTFSYFVPKEVSTSSFKVPALGFSVPSYTLLLPSLELSFIHVPETLSDIKLPTFALPAIQNNIVIPAMGNMTCDFSFKSTFITLSANGGLYNQSDIVGRFSAASTSVFDKLNGKIDGTSSLTRKRGIKLTTTVSLEHNNIVASHNSEVSLTRRNMEASMANAAKINLPFLNLDINQEVIGQTKTQPNVVFKENLNYIFYIPLIESVGKGNLDMNWALEALSSYVSLEVSTQGKSDITIMDSRNFAGHLDNKASFYLNANSLRATVRTALNTNIAKQEKQRRSTNNILQFDMSETLALEVSLQRLFAAVDYTSNNNINVASFSTKGKHIIKGELDLVPLTTLVATLKIDASQPSSLAHTGVSESLTLSISSAKQSFTWSGKEQLADLIHARDLLVSNDESEARMDLTGSVEGHLVFLKSVKLPVYQKTVWDVLKFDQVTNIDDLQFLNISSSIVYTKSMDGYEYNIPSKHSENGIIFSIPEISIAMPSLAATIPKVLRNTDILFESRDDPDDLLLPPVISVPAFNVPFTNLHVEPFTIDPMNLKIPAVITTTAFEIILPGLPIISVPSYDIRTEYLQGKMSFLSFKMPLYQISVSSFTPPKSFTVGDHMINLDEITKHISGFELPTIVIPEQNVEIPEIALHLPSSVFIPTFGALSATLKVSSPIYKVSTTASLERKDPGLVTSLNSICTSTMMFLEYDLSASATFGFDNGVFNLNGKCNLVHNDINVDLQHVLSRNLRMKHQVPLAASMESHHTLNIDITSRTFFDAMFRFASHKEGVTASVSSPSSGFIGLYLQRRSMSQLYGKVFCRYLSSPEKDRDVFTAKATLKNSQRLVLQTSWNLDFLHDVTEGTKDRIPAMTDAVVKFINKYHTAHFGFDLNLGGMKLKNTVSNVIERAYHEVPLSVSTLQNSIQHLRDQGKDLYRKASDSLVSMRTGDVMNRLAQEARAALKSTEGVIYAFLDVVSQFLADIRFTVPGSEEKLSILEMVRRAHWAAVTAADRASQRIESLLQKMRKIEFTIPVTNITVNGNEIRDKLRSFTRFLFDQLDRSVQGGFHFLQKTFNNLVKMIDEKRETFITYVQNENGEIASKVDAIHAEILQYSSQHIEEVKRHLADYKDLTKLNIQKVYNAFNMERVNNDTNGVISIFQSHLYGGLNEAVDLMRRTSQITAPYVKVTNTKMDIEIPLPFLWKSFSEWPKRSTH